MADHTVKIWTGLSFGPIFLFYAVFRPKNRLGSPSLGWDILDLQLTSALHLQLKRKICQFFLLSQCPHLRISSKISGLTLVYYTNTKNQSRDAHFPHEVVQLANSIQVICCKVRFMLHVHVGLIFAQTFLGKCSSILTDETKGISFPIKFF